MEVLQARQVEEGGLDSGLPVTGLAEALELDLANARGRKAKSKQ